MHSFPALELAWRLPGDHEPAELRLRPWRESDIPAVVRACADPDTRRWLALPRSYTPEDAAIYIASREVARRRGDGVYCAVTLARDGAVVGSVGLTRTDWRARITELGYWALPEHRGHGYITAATRALSTWVLQQGFARIELRAATENVASNRVAVRAGFRLEGTLENAGIVPGARVDLNLYALTAQQGDTAGAGAPD